MNETGLLKTKKHTHFYNAFYEKTKTAIHTADALCNKLVLIVGEHKSGKTELLRYIATEDNLEVLNINLLLSSELLDMTARQRALHLSRILNDIVDKVQGTLLLDNLEILFDIELKQDPLRLLQNLSRNRVVVASWNGCVSGSKLIYAEINHPEYRDYEIKDELIIDLNKALI